VRFSDESINVYTRVSSLGWRVRYKTGGLFLRNQEERACSGGFLSPNHRAPLFTRRERIASLHADYFGT